MDEIIVEGVRCFYERQSIPLRKLTVLVGENSSGKSTFLALTRLAWSICQGAIDVDFNEEPFRLGAFDQIASRIGGRMGNAKEFSVGAKVYVQGLPSIGRSSPIESNVQVCGIFMKSNAQPRLSRWSLESRSHSVLVNYGPKFPEWSFSTPSGVSTVVTRYVYSRDALVYMASMGDLLSLGGVHDLEGTAPSKDDLEALRDLSLAISWVAPSKPYAFAPIRTQPQRTYDPLKEIPDPQGSHVPMTLARIASSDSKAWKNLALAVQEFGRASGLFTNVEVRKMGKDEGDPFQIRVKIAGSAFNLVDVGYGVSQILPIVVDILRSEGRGTFLLQQPEVHLHPKAQAELGSFLAAIATATGKRFVVETHSDYLVDRIRMDIRDRRNIEPKDVQILYFERQNGKVKVHPIEIDENGNLESVPKGYRSFFLEEERRFLGG